MKKAIITFFLVSAGAFGIMNDVQVKVAEPQHFFNPSPLEIAGKAAILMDEQTGDVLYAVNEHDRLFPASTTKLLTALVVMDKAGLDERVTIGKEALIDTGGEARVGILPGQVFTVKELLAATLLQSGNDTARSLAVHVASKEHGEPLPPEEAIPLFSQLMNQKAKALGAHDSQFMNPHGLHDDGHFSTAFDLAMIAKAARQNEVIKSMVSQVSFNGANGVYINRNKLMQKENGYYLPEVTGMKTGFTDQAGYCLVSSAEKEGKQLLSVVLFSGQDTVWSDSTTLLSYGFER